MHKLTPTGAAWRAARWPILAALGAMVLLDWWRIPVWLLAYCGLLPW